MTAVNLGAALTDIGLADINIGYWFWNKPTRILWNTTSEQPLIPAGDSDIV